MTTNGTLDIIDADQAGTLGGLFAERVRRSPRAIGYREFDPDGERWRDHAWADVAAEAARWQRAFEREQLVGGERVAIMLRNCVTWVAYDQAALASGLVVVPLYTQDRPDNVAFILRDCGARVLLVDNPEVWAQLRTACEVLGDLVRVVVLRGEPAAADGPRVVAAQQWLPAAGGELRQATIEPDAMASIVYTSGTTGRPKGVMLSHRNMLSNAAAVGTKMAIRRDDMFLSFLPLSHTFERTVGYYLTVQTGSTTTYARSVSKLAEDLQTVRPTVLISVPRIYERVHAAIRGRLAEGTALARALFDVAVRVGWRRFEYRQGRASWSPSLLLWPLLDVLVARKLRERLGGRVRAALSGGAALSPDVSRVFVGLGVTILQGYGLTETSPVICANRPEDNVPASVGTTVPGVEARLGEHDALLVRGPNVMLGYWNNPEATRAMIVDGWLNTGDTARFDRAGRIYITGRLKEIIVLSNGEKVPPGDIEAAILRDTLFEQVLLVGEGRPYLSALVVLDAERWREAAAQRSLDPQAPNAEAARAFLVERIAAQMGDFPGYAQVHRATATLEPWTVENGLMTPTLKLRRARVMERFLEELDAMYSGH